MNAVHPHVVLSRTTPNPEQAIAAAAKLCYASNAEGLFDQDAADAAVFVKHLVRMGHMSPLEHASFTFYIEGISRAMTHQLVRHRLASYSQRSQRYVNHDGFDYVVPSSLDGKVVHTAAGEVNAREYYDDTMRMIAERYARLNDALGRTGEESNQDARYVLPNACETKIFVTMNARELLHFFEERLCQRAQWEIRNVAEEMWKLVRDACPAVFDGAGPKCIRRGCCPEGKKTCGRYTEVKARYVTQGFN